MLKVPLAFNFTEKELPHISKINTTSHISLTGSKLTLSIACQRWHVTKETYISTRLKHLPETFTLLCRGKGDKRFEKYGETNIPNSKILGAKP